MLKEDGSHAPQTIGVSGSVGSETMRTISLYRPRHDRVLGGVASGLAYRFGLPGLVPYMILWFVMPSE